MTRAQQELCKTLRAERRVNIDDQLANEEIERCRCERLKSNGSATPPELERGFCHCAELIVNGKRQPRPKHHSCSYVAARSALVPQAEEIANRRVVICLASEDGGASQARWMKNYTRAMERLAASLR